MGVGSLTGAVLAKKTETSGYDYYVESAQTASMQDKITYYKKAIALNPGSGRCMAWFGERCGGR